MVVVVPDNKAADALQVALRAGCDLTGAIPPNRVLKLPAHDVLPFENLSPHPEIQEQRAATLWKMATGSASIVIAPVEAAAMKLFPRHFYGGLAQVLRRGEEVDVDTLLAHLASVGYTPMDIVEMPGQYTRRGGIVDIYSPEADRPGPHSNSSATRSRPSASSIPRRNGRLRRSTKPFCFHSRRLPLPSVCWPQCTRD